MAYELAQNDTQQPAAGPVIAEVGDPNAGQADILVSGDYTIIGIFLVWAGLIAFAWMLVRRVKQGAFRFPEERGEKPSYVPPFKPLDTALGFIGTVGFVTGFGLVMLDLIR